MTCKNIERILPGYVDDALSRAERAQVEEHLAACPACRVVLVELKRTREIVQGIGEVDAPAWLAPQIMAHVRAESDRRHGIIGKLFFPLHVKIPLEALAMICVALLVVAVYRAGGPEVQQLALNPTPPAQQSQDAGVSEAPEHAAQPILPAPSTHVRMPNNTVVQHKQMSPISGTAGMQASPVANAGEKAAQEGRIGMLAQPAPSLPEQQALGEEKDAEALPAGMAEKKAKQEKFIASDTSEPVKRTLAPQAAVSLRAESAPAPEYTLKMTVPDMHAAAGKVEELMRAFHAQGIEQQAKAGMIVLTSRLRTEDMSAFVTRLKLLGEITGVPILPHATREVTAIRVEIVSSD